MSKIKRLKPSGKNSGDFRIYKPKKYLGNMDEPIWFRSSYELRYMRQLESNPNVVGWNSENIAISYIMPEQKKDKYGKFITIVKKRTYYMDFEVHLLSGQKFLCEVKPLSFVPLNEAQLRKTSEHFKNANKWKATIQWCKNNGYKFQLITEKELGIKPTVKQPRPKFPKR